MQFNQNDWFLLISKSNKAVDTPFNHIDGATYPSGTFVDVKNWGITEEASRRWLNPIISTSEFEIFPYKIIY